MTPGMLVEELQALNILRDGSRDADGRISGHAFSAKLFSRLG
jgi:hypothetical protein